MRAYVKGSRIGITSISSMVSRARLGMRVRYDPRLPDHSAFCWIPPRGTITLRLFGILGTSELHLGRRIADADLDLGVLEPEVGEPHNARVVVDRETHDVEPRRRVQRRPDVIDRHGAGLRDESLVEGRPRVRAAQLQRVREGLVHEPEPGKAVPGGGVVDPEDRVAWEVRVFLAVPANSSELTSSVVVPVTIPLP